MTPDEELDLRCAQIVKRGADAFTLTALIKAVERRHAHELAEKIREAVSDMYDPGNEGVCPLDACQAANLIDPASGDKVNERCTCGETACESELCDCDAVPCPVDHAAEFIASGEG